jgi:hypothetical protein
MFADACSDVESKDFAESRQRFREFADAGIGCAYIVEIFAVSARDRKAELVEAGPAAKDELVAEVGIIRDLTDEPAQQQVLLDLRAGCPGGN